MAIIGFVTWHLTLVGANRAQVGHIVGPHLVDHAQHAGWEFRDQGPSFRLIHIQV